MSKTQPLDAVLTFGKYKGQTIQEVIGTARGEGWIKWAVQNIEWFEISDDVRKIIESRTAGRRRQSEHDEAIREAQDDTHLWDNYEKYM